MIPFNYNIKTLEDVQNEFKFLDVKEFLNKADVIKLAEKEFKELKADEEYYSGRKISKARLVIMKEVATAKGLYKFLWAVENTTDVMLKWGWNQTDIVKLMDKAKKAGYNPYDDTRNGVGEYIESLPGYGYSMKTIKNKTFRAYDPWGNKQ